MIGPCEHHKGLDRGEKQGCVRTCETAAHLFVLAALVAVPIYFLTRKSLGNDIALVLLITTALPFFFFALYERTGSRRKRC